MDRCGEREQAEISTDGSQQDEIAKGVCTQKNLFGFGYQGMLARRMSLEVFPLQNFWRSLRRIGVHCSLNVS